jgi:hypothetical protein
MEWYSRRGEDSENRIKDLKIGFGMEYMPCGSFRANAAFFSIGALTYNLYLGFRSHALGSGWEPFAGADRAPAAVSDGGQDRPPWSTDVFENQRGDAGRIYRDPRVLRARHAGRRRHSRNVLTPGAAFSRFWKAAHTAPPIAAPRPRHSKTPTLAVEIVIGGRGRLRRRP